MGPPVRHAFIAFLLVGVLVANNDAIRVDKSGKRMDRADHAESSEDYDDAPSYEDEDKEKDSKYNPRKSKDDDKDFFKSFKSLDFDSSEFASISDKGGLKRRESSFDWGDDDDYDFPDFKDFPEEPRESPSSGYASHISLQAGLPNRPFNQHQYSITHPRSPSKKKFDFDGFDFNSKEESEGAYSSKIHTPEIPDSSSKEGIIEYGPLLKIPIRRHKDISSHRISSDSTNTVAKKVKFDPEKAVKNYTNCFKAKKKMASSNDKFMTCYVCFDGDHEKMFERCSYDSEPKRKEFSYESRTKHKKGDRSRKKREIFPDDSSEVGFGFGDFNLGADSAEFFSPEFDDVEDPDRRRSGSKNETPLSDSSAGRSCLTTKKNNMVCVRCMDPSSNRLSEQCSYESDPVENSYQYSSKKSYGSPREPKINYPDRYKRSLTETLTRRRKIIQKENSTKINSFGLDKPATEDVKNLSLHHKSGQNFTSSTPKNDYFLRMFENLVGNKDDWDVAKAVNSMSDNETEIRDPDDSASVFVFEDSADGAFRAVPNNYRRMLGEFVSRDWSNCTLSIKGNLTCYQCEDGGAMHEECIQISHVEEPNVQLGDITTNDALQKRYFLNKISPKKFDSASEIIESQMELRSRRLPRSPVESDFDDTSDGFSFDHDSRPDSFFDSYNQGHHHTSAEYDPQYELHAHRYSSDHDVPSWYHLR